MTDELRLIDTNVLAHAYTVSDERKHEAALSLVEKVWEGEAAAKQEPEFSRQFETYETSEYADLGKMADARKGFNAVEKTTVGSDQ